MIVRAAARRRRAHLLAASFAQLNLPWLAPAQLRWVASQAATTTVTKRTRRKSIKGIESPRQLATAVETSNTSTKRYDPEESLPWAADPTQQPPSLSTIRPPGKPVQVPFDPHAPTQERKNAREGQGNISELLANLHTTLRVGRTDRALAIIQRMVQYSSVTSPEVRYALSIFFEEMMGSVQAQSADSEEARIVLAEMEHTFAKRVRKIGVPIDSSMLVYLIRSVIHAESGQARADKLKLYMQEAEHLDAESQADVFMSPEYTDEEMAVINPDVSDDVADVDTASVARSDVKPVRQEFEQLDMSEIDEVRSVVQKGIGVEGTKKVLLPLVRGDIPLNGANVNDKNRLAMERQLEIERNAVQVAVEKWHQADEELKKIGINTAMKSKPVSALMYQWYSALLPALEEELRECRASMAGEKLQREPDRMHYGPYLELLDLSNVAAQTILFTLNSLITMRNSSPETTDAELKIGRLTASLSKTLEDEYISRQQAQRVKKALKPAHGKRFKSKVQRMRDSEHDKIEADVAWPLNMRVKLGAMLVSKLLEVAQLPVTREDPRTKEQITQMQPGFVHCSTYVRGKRLGTIKAHQQLISKLETEPVHALLAKKMPMLVEPLPWTGWKEGGYYLQTEPIVRVAPGDRSTRDYFAAAFKQGDLEQIFHGLNSLSKVPWRINRDVFKVQLEAWNSGEAVANLAPLNPELPTPPEPVASPDPTARRKWISELRDIENEKSGIHSQRCFQNFQLEIARAMINETIYFPHNVDFRGRAYPIPPYLNHMGADNVRALMNFADGKELGQDGLRWLKIHLANVAGYDKASLQQREDFTMNHLDDIRDSVADPMGGGKWWLKSEDAWQCLAACFELVHALDSPDPTKYISHLPIHQDGTCNGLQHYAALGGDVAGAMHVNLEPGDKPADVYAGVANAVIEEIKKDVEAGHEIAKFLDGHITRKVVKQPVMTNVYGVTFFGAKAQVRKQLEDIFPDVRRFDEINHGVMSHYITIKIFKSLGSMFAGAQAIQQWLGQCADRISTCVTPDQVRYLINEEAKETEKELSGKAKSKKSSSAAETVKNYFKSTVVWTTPLRLPVAQPYRRTKHSQVLTKLQAISIAEPSVFDSVNRKKQMQAFPPNFIHSLDATHMLLSAMRCSEAGLTFASIHDSFWTHACDIPRMSQVLRDAFVSMHSDDIIGRLREEFVARYQDCMYLTSVPEGTPLAKEISAWRKKHMKELKELGKHGELRMEMERMRLLKSPDKAEQKKGKAMKTPGSLLDAAGYEYLDTSVETVSTGLGSMPTQGLSEETLKDTLDENDENTATAGVAEKKAKASAKKVAVWRSMHFPDVPKKGSFDVRRLKESKYFFH